MKTLLILPLLTALVQFNAMANAAAVAMQDDKQPETSPSLPLFQSDGYVEVHDFYRDGPRFRICPPAREGHNINVRNSRCVESDALKGGIIADYSPQDYLDRLFGQGETHFTGLSFYFPQSRLGLSKRVLVLFYQTKH